MLDLKLDYGAVGDGVTNDTTAVQNWIAALISTGEKGYVPKGVYKCNSRMLFGMPGNNGNSVIIEGEGAYKSVFDLSGAPTNQGAQVHFYTATATPTSCYPHVSDVGFSSNTPGTVVALGLEDVSDNIGNLNFTNVFVGNSNTTSSNSAIALQINYVFDSVFTNVVCVGKVGYGTALDMRLANFCTFIGGSFSNANYGIRIRDHTNVANTFMGADIENVNWGIRHENSSSESNVFINTFIDQWRPDLTPAVHGTGYVFSSTAAGGRGFVIRDAFVSVRSRTPHIDPVNNVNIFVK